MSYPPPPPASEQPTSSPVDNERLWAAAAHIGSLVAAWVALGLLAPLMVLLLMGERSAYVKQHATESLNFQISLLIYTVVGVLVALVTLGVGLLVVIPVAIGVMVLALVAIIMATLAANRGEDFRYPLNIRLVR